MSDEAKPWESLGYDTFDALLGDQKEKLEKLEQRIKEKDGMINRQADEVGEARKQVKEMEKASEEVQTLKERLAKLEESSKVQSGGTVSDSAPEPTPADTLDQLSEADLEKRFSDEQVEEFERFVTNLPPENQELISSSDEARAEAKRSFLRNQTRQAGLFRHRNKQVASEKDVKALIREMFAQQNRGNRAPASVTPDGPPPRERYAEEHEKTARTLPKVTQQSGSLLEGIRNARV